MGQGVPLDAEPIEEECIDLKTVGHCLPMIDYRVGDSDFVASNAPACMTQGVLKRFLLSSWNRR